MGVEKGVRDDEEDNAVVPLHKEIKCLKIESAFKWADVPFVS